MQKRFHSRTEFINLRRLGRETNRVLALGLVVSVCVHAALFALVRFDQTTPRIVRPMTMELIIRQPRMTRPFVIPRRDFVRRALERQITQRMPEGDFQLRELPRPEDIIELARDQFVAITPEELRGVVAEIIADISRSYREGLLDSLDQELYPVEINEYLTSIEREAADMLSLRDELLSIDNLDTGQYRAVVIKDPDNLQNLTGFAYIPSSIWGVDLNPNVIQGTLVPPDTGRMAIIGLVEGFTKHTNLQIKPDPQLQIDQPKLREYPIIYISSEQSFRFTVYERESMRAYIDGGGFLMLEPYSVQGLRALQQMVEDAFEGRARITTIPDDHPILRCYYEFENPKVPINSQFITMPETMFQLDGIFLGDTLIGLLLTGDYGAAWAAGEYENPYFRVAVNAVTYALIRQGSAAKQYISAD